MVRTFAIVLALTATASADPAFVAAGSEQPRAHRDVSYRAPAQAVLGELASWTQVWDADTGVPLRMWGPSLPAFGALATPAIAENVARGFLADHLALLAPGAAVADFTVVSNERRGVIRTIGFAQSYRGIPVLGGSIAVTFERDHLVMVGSTALPAVVAHVPASTLADATTEAAATSLVRERVVSHGARAIIPLIYAHSISYRVAETVRLERDDVFVDASDGSPVARLSRIAYGSGSVLFDTPDRYPAGGRSPKLAPNATHTVDGVLVTSDANGLVTWPGSADASVAPTPTGPLTTVATVTGDTVADMLSLADAGSVTWSHPDDPSLDAQIDAFVFASQAKTFAATKLDPSLEWLTQQTNVSVNDTSGTCNAYSSDDNSLHFYKENAMCENTGRIADVVYHEFGHSVHRTSIIPGVGYFDASASEGYADTLCVSITGDHGMGRGFFYTDAPLRDLDPVGIEKRWPDDADGEPHDEGEIIGETLWDLRKALQIKYGTDAGFALLLHIYDGELQRSVDIPSTYAEALVADDDDGDLANGVPDECEINAAFGLHGLTTPEVTLALVPPTRVGNTVSLVVHPPAHDNAACPFGVASVTLTWRLRDGASVGQLAMTSTGNDTYSGDVPQQPDGSVVLYRVTLLTTDGSKMTYPDNRADPDYQMYIGPVTTLACFDFEAGWEGWTHAGNATSSDEWEVGAPEGLGGDPSAAHGGANAIGTDLDHDGFYKQMTEQWAVSPAIDLKGFTNVRLQYYRWLQVRDGAQDKATIAANATAVWANFASASAQQPLLTPHLDKEWRFQDVDLTTAIAGAPTATVKFDLAASRGGGMGGWTIDDVCIVATGSAGAVCGNGIVEPGESCDDGNVANGDGCSATCQTDTTPPGMSSGGCCSTGNTDPSAILLALTTLGLMFKKTRFK